MPSQPAPSFFMIVQLHHLQALLHLGELPNPATGNPNPPNLPKARHELALLEVLAEKTSGNLNEEELRILTQVIESLRDGIAAVKA
ncbi:hypothetical protein BH09SUM1_BH09SUM1_18300 [soil metagenome]